MSEFGGHHEAPPGEEQDDGFASALQKLMRNRKLVERCIYISSERPGSDALNTEALFQFTEQLWTRQPEAIQAVQAIRNQLETRHAYLTALGERTRDEQEEMNQLLYDQALLGLLVEDRVPPTKPFSREDELFMRPLPAEGGRTGIILGSGSDLPRRGATGESMELEPVPERLDGTEMLPPDHVEKAFSPLEIPGVVDVRAIEIPRTAYFQDLLRELDIAAEEVIVLPGKLGKGWMRTLPYHGELLPHRDRKGRKVVFLNDESGEATFVIHDVLERNPEEDALHYSAHTKSELRALGELRTSRLCWTGDPITWKAALSTILERKAVSKLEHDRYTLALEQNPLTEYASSSIIGERVKKMFNYTMNDGIVQHIIGVLLEQNNPPFSQAPTAEREPLSQRGKGKIAIYSPEVVDRFFDLLPLILCPSEEWKQSRGVLRLVQEELTRRGLFSGLDFVTVEKKIQEVRKKAGSDWHPTGPMCGYFIGKGVVTEEETQHNPLLLKTFCSPELIQRVVLEFVEETVLPGWKTANIIEMELKKEGVGGNSALIDTARKILERSGNSTYTIKFFRAVGPRRTANVKAGERESLKLHYSPEFAEAIKQWVRERSRSQGR